MARMRSARLVEADVPRPPLRAADVAERAEPARAPRAASRPPASRRRPRPLRRRDGHRGLTIAVAVSLLLHVVIASLAFHGSGRGLPGLRLPWQERRLEVPDLQIVLMAPPPSAAPAPAEPREVPVTPVPVPIGPRPVAAVVAPTVPSAAATPTVSLATVPPAPPRPAEPVAVAASEAPPAVDLTPLPQAPMGAASAAPPVDVVALDASRREAERQAALREEAARADAARLEQRAAEQREAARAAAAREEADRQQALRREAEEAGRAEAARAEAARAEAARAEAARAEAARVEAVRAEAARQESARQEAARLAAARVAAEQEATSRREATLRAIGRQLDAESAERDASAKAAREAPSLPLSLSTARRLRLWGRADANAELVQYAETFARKIQLNTPADTVRSLAAQPHVNPMVTVAIRSDGSVESVTFVVSSGVAAIDEAIRRIIESEKPYRPFSPRLAGDADVIEIRRTWHLGDAVRLY